MIAEQPQSASRRSRLMLSTAVTEMHVEPDAVLTASEISMKLRISLAWENRKNGRELMQLIMRCTYERAWINLVASCPHCMLELSVTGSSKHNSCKRWNTVFSFRPSHCIAPSLKRQESRCQSMSVGMEHEVRHRHERFDIDMRDSTRNHRGRRIEEDRTLCAEGGHQGFAVDIDDASRINGY